MKCPNCEQEAPEGKTYCSRACANKHRRIKERQSRKTYVVWSCGGGVHSVALGLLIANGKVKRPDYSVMVDTGYEKTETMEYVQQHLIPYMRQHGVDLQIVHTTEYADNAYMKNGYVLIPGFKFSDGSTVDKLKTNCNQAWKVTVIRKWLLGHGVEQYESLIGIAADEAHRQRKPHTAYYSNTYPLINLGMDMQACMDYILSCGLPVPPRSSCVMCAQQSEAEWWRMAVRYPDDLKKAADIEAEIQREIPGFYLHRTKRNIPDVFEGVQGMQVYANK